MFGNQKIRKDLFYPLRVLHGRLHEWRLNEWQWIKKRIQNPRAVFLVLTPEHGNLGDHAIAQAEVQLLHELNISYIELTGKKLSYLESKHSLSLMNGRTILLHGGGYLGTIWLYSEMLTRSIIQQNPKSRIIMLPNTIYYENDDNGHSELLKSIEIYNAHPHLKMYAREMKSFVMMKAVYQNVSIAPDMVLRMNKCKSGMIRNGCILCLRNDCEKTRSEDIDKAIDRQVRILFGDNVETLDMLVPHPIPIIERDSELEKQFDAFRHAELVVTDRLHGMIFCAITGTPCIVIDSKSPKIRGCYEWIKDLPYIIFCEDIDEISLIYKTISKQEWLYDNASLLSFFEPVKQDILLETKRTKKNVTCKYNHSRF